MWTCPMPVLLPLSRCGCSAPLVTPFLLSSRSHQLSPRPSRRWALREAKRRVIMDQLKCPMCLLLFSSFLLSEATSLAAKTSAYLGND